MRHARGWKLNEAQDAERAASAGVHRRNGNEHKDDPGARTLREGRAPSLQRPLWPLEDPDFRRRAALRRPDAPWVIDAPMDRTIFETYVRTQLVPTLQEGDIVILDNLPAHKSPAAEQAIRERGAWLMFLPPYSPDLNPIEMAFAKLKAHLRAMGKCTIDELWKAIGQICDLFKPQECANYFEAAGYGFK